MNIGSRIKKIRQMLNKSQQNLADELSLTKQAISNIETGKSLPGMSLLSKLFVDYGINLNYVICGKGPIFVDDESNRQSLREVILKEVEKMLVERGID